MPGSVSHIRREEKLVLIFFETAKQNLASLPLPAAAKEADWLDRRLQFTRRLAVRALTRLFVRGLQLLGYRFFSLSEALRSPAPRKAVICFDASTDVLPVFASRGFLRRHCLPATLFVAPEQLISRPDPRRTHLSWTEVEHLHKLGWEIGTVGRRLTHLLRCSHDEQEALIATAKSAIEEKTGALVKVFAYPFGAYDATTVACLRDQDFVAAVTQREGINETPAVANGAFHLRRLVLRAPSPRDFWLKDAWRVLITLGSRSRPVLGARVKDTPHVSREVVRARATI